MLFFKAVNFNFAAQII